MTWQSLALNGLVHAILGGTLCLLAGCLAVHCCRQPVRRVRLIELTLAGSLLVPLASQLPWLPHWSVGLIPATPTVDETPAPAAPRTADFGAERPLVTPFAFAAANDETKAGAPSAVVAETAAGVIAPTAEPAAFSASWSWPSPTVTVVALYGLVAAGLLLWTLYGLLRLARLYRSAFPVPPQVSELFRAMAGPAGERIRLLASDRVELPLTFTFWRPVIVLPAGLCREDNPAALRYCLAHEWSHVEGGDAWRWYLATLAQPFLFYQPLFWWLRRQLRLCQDYLADARAAEQAPEAEDYAEYLVGLARRRLGLPAIALGIHDRRSNLYRRITMLLQTREPLERRCLGRWTLAATAAAVVLLAAFSAVRLDAGSPADDAKKDKDPPKEAAKDKPAEKGETLNYTGKVTDKATGKPIEGATVTVRRSLYGDPEIKEEDRLMQETKHTTNADGKYSFVIPPEQSSKRYTYIELDVEHPEYAPRKRFGYALGMIRKNEKMGGRPFFESVELWPGKAITGTIKTPDGAPAAGVKVMAYSNTSKQKQGEFEYGSFAETTTDDGGRFRLVVITPGPAAYWILPEKYAPSTHGVRGDKRGEMGTFTLSPGVVLRGQVLDAKGNPVAGVNVNAESREPNEALQGLAVADSINRSAVTNEKGEFEMAPLPPGRYQVKPDERPRDSSKKDRTVRPLPAVFIGKQVTLKDGADKTFVEVRAVPHVTIDAQVVDSKGKPTRGHAFYIFGRMDNSSWFGQGKPDANGHIVVHAPHGLEQVNLDLSTNEHGVLRWRMNKDAPLNNNRRVDLGTLNDDVRGFEIVRYTAPILLVDAKDKDGKQVKDFKVKAEYTSGKNKKAPGSRFINGVQGDQYFEKQEDNRWRTSQMFPDEELLVTVSADGYESKSEKVQLAEGQTKDLNFVLDKAAAKEKKEEQKEDKK